LEPTAASLVLRRSLAKKEIASLVNDDLEALDAEYQKTRENLDSETISKIASLRQSILDVQEADKPRKAGFESEHQALRSEEDALSKAFQSTLDTLKVFSGWESSKETIALAERQRERKAELNVRRTSLQKRQDKSMRYGQGRTIYSYKKEIAALEAAHTKKLEAFDAEWKERKQSMLTEFRRRKESHKARELSSFV
jgi:hypothetical protein